MYGSMRRLLKPNSPWKPPRLLEGRCSILRRLSRSEEEESSTAPSGFMMGDTHCPGPVTSGQGAEDYLARAGLGKWGGQLGLGVSSLAMYCEPTNWKLYHFHSQSSSVTELAFHLKLVQSTGIGFGCQRPYAFYCHFCYLVPNFAPVQLSFSKKSSHYISKPSFKYFIPQNWVALKSMCLLPPARWAIFPPMSYQALHQWREPEVEVLYFMAIGFSAYDLRKQI